ncbi:MAG: peptidoglycan-binding domain-containing protein [Minisyncoccia bacterium]
MSRKLVLGVAALALAFSVSTVSAATVADLQAMIAQLQAQLAALSGGASASAGYTFTRDLTVGSTGADVTALQQALVSKGFLTMPAGVSMGYFGNLTKMSVAKWQASAGISPAAGYVGPKSRAALNSVAGGSTPATPATPAATGITTVGAEGTITAELNPTPGTGLTLREGETQDAFIGIKVKATLSDLDVQRVKLQLGASTDTNGQTADFYNKVFPTVYLLDGSTVIAKSSLNSTSVVKEGSSYYVTLTGFHFLVAKDTTKVLTVAVDLNSSVDSTYDGDSFSITVPVNGVRAVDGAGINQEGPTTAFSRSQTVDATSVAEDATLQLALNGNSPKSASVIAADGSNENQRDGVQIASIDLTAKKDSIKITDFVVGLKKAGPAAGGATTSTVWLYDAANPAVALGSATVNTGGDAAGVGYAAFNDIDTVIPKDTTKTWLVKVDIRSADSTRADINFTASSTGITAENSEGSTMAAADITGSADGEVFTFRNVGPEFALVGTPSVTYGSAGAYAGATSTAKADFVISMKAVGGDVYFGDTGSTTYALADQNSTATAGESIVPYIGGAATHPIVSSSTAIQVSSGGSVSTTAEANTWKLAEGGTVNIPISFVMETRVVTVGTLITTGAYSFGLERLNWLSLAGGRQTDTFMAGKQSWRTSTVTLP